MDQRSRRLLIGGALFLEAAEKAQTTKEHYSDHFRFRQRSTLSHYVNGFLDAMALLLVPSPGGNFVTACSLDLPLDSHPSPQKPQEFTLRIARNGAFSSHDDQALKDSAGRIIELMQGGERLYA